MKHYPSRRDFLTTTATTTAGSILLSRSALAAAADSGGIGETEHFHYRLSPPDGPYIDSQRDNKAFAFHDGKILLSEDNGKTWPHSADFPNAENITFSCILGNGNVLFATRAKLYLSTDNLKTHRQLTVIDRDGSDYLAHTPKDPDNPGWYFHTLDGVHTWQIDGEEMLVWGNYCNVLGGAVPVNIYYSTDGGETVKVAYSFGKNPKNMLGAADNPVIARHIHNVVYHDRENAFYVCTGDFEKECHWLRGTYDKAADQWEWKVLISVDSNSRYKSGGINFVDGQIYWAADANGPKTLRETYDRGIFRCAPGDLTDPDKHTLLHNPGYECANMIIEDDFIIAAHCAPASPYDCGFLVSPDLGKSWAHYDLKEFGKRSGVRFHPKNAEGWFRVDLRSSWITPDGVLFVKPKA